MENTRQAILSTKDVDIESGDYVAVPIGDENELWFTQTHFAEIRELMMLSEEMKSSRQVTSISADADDENAKSGLSVYAGYIGKPFDGEMVLKALLQMLPRMETIPM